jgi:hypothetical protein
MERIDVFGNGPYQPSQPIMGFFPSGGAGLKSIYRTGSGFIGNNLTARGN